MKKMFKFSVGDLLVVFGILAVLAVMMIPAMRTARQKAKELEIDTSWSDTIEVDGIPSFEIPEGSEPNGERQIEAKRIIDELFQETRRGAEYVCRFDELCATTLDKDSAEFRQKSKYLADIVTESKDRCVALAENYEKYIKEHKIGSSYSGKKFLYEQEKRATIVTMRLQAVSRKHQERLDELRKKAIGIK